MTLPTGNYVAPSVLAADHGRLRDQVKEMIDAGATVVHVDVMDGHFVPPLTFGPGIVAGLRDLGVMLDVHLMIERPERHVAALAQIRDAGSAAGLAVCPGTPLDVFTELEGSYDLALCMTVNPGWGGQKFIGSSLEKLERLAPLLPEGVALEVDGGIDAGTAGPCASRGATLFVAGNAIFGAPDPAAAYAGIAAAIEAGAAAPLHR
jgi:ribulose-phosphate 3-epimerase